MRTKTGLYNHPQLTYQTWQTNSRYKYQPPLPLGRCEFDSWCSLAPAVGMRKHGMGAEERQSENCLAGLVLCREGGDLPVHSTKPVDGGAARRLVVAPGGRLSPQSATKGCASGTTPTAPTATCEHGAGACGGGQLRVRPLPCGGVAVATECRAGRMRRCGRRGRARGVRCLGTSPAPCGSVERALGARNKHVITSVGSLAFGEPSCRHRKSSPVIRV